MTPAGLSASTQLRPISFNVGHAIRAVVFSCLIYGFFSLWALLLSRIGVADNLSLAVAHLGAITAYLTCWRLGRWGRAKVDGFGAVLLLMGIALGVHALLDTLAYGTRIEDVQRYRAVPLTEPVIDIFLKGELISVTGLILVACSWRYAIGHWVEQFSFVNGARPVPPKVSWLVYFMALASGILDKVLGVGLGPLAQLAWMMGVFGVAAIYFICAGKNPVVRRVAMAGLLALPMAAMALGRGMKEELLFPLIPAAILYWVGFRSFRARALAVLGGVALLVMVQAYVQYVRETTWRPGSVAVDVSGTGLVQGFGASAQEVDTADTFDDISRRINQTTAHLITVTIADNRGHEPMAVFGAIPGSVIPRVIWPGKPVLRPGAMHTSRILGIDGLQSGNSTSTTAGFFTELYLGGWWWGVVIGSVLFGTLFAAAQKWALRYDPILGHQALCFLGLYSALRFDGNHTLYAYTNILTMVVFVWLLGKVTRSVAPGYAGQAPGRPRKAHV